jgi:hypothetical protein
MNSDDAVSAFDSFGDKSVHQMSVQSKLRDWGASAEESAAALQAALDGGVLVMDQLGAISKP